MSALKQECLEIELKKNEMQSLVGQPTNTLGDPGQAADEFLRKLEGIGQPPRVRKI